MAPGVKDTTHAYKHTVMTNTGSAHARNFLLALGYEDRDSAATSTTGNNSSSGSTGPGSADG